MNPPWIRRDMKWDATHSHIATHGGRLPGFSKPPSSKTSCTEPVDALGLLWQTRGTLRSLPVLPPVRLRRTSSKDLEC